MKLVYPSLILIAAAAALQPAAGQLSFTAHEVATGLRGGYQVIAADLNRDNRPDLIAIASGLTEVVWFENPGWQRHVLITGLRSPINAAAADIDADGIPEIAVAHGFAMTAAQSAGIVTLLTHGPDVTQPWTAREIDRAPTAHRLRWILGSNTGAAGAPILVNAPLIGDTLRAPDYRGNTPIYLYRSPDWKREVLSLAEQGVIHSIEPIPPGPRFDSAGQPLPAGRNPLLAAASFLGVAYFSMPASAGAPWTRTNARMGSAEPWPRSGASEVAFVGTTGNTNELTATIEPWHGNTLVLYTRARGSAEVRRRVLDSTLTDAHTLISADFDNDGLSEIVAGERGGARSVRIYRSTGVIADWTRLQLDAGSMAAAGCVAVDLNGDRKVDLACIGTATANLKWYENK